MACSFARALCDWTGGLEIGTACSLPLGKDRWIVCCMLYSIAGVLACVIVCARVRDQSTFRFQMKSDYCVLRTMVRK